MNNTNFSGYQWPTGYSQYPSVDNNPQDASAYNNDRPTQYQHADTENIAYTHLTRYPLKAGTDECASYQRHTANADDDVRTLYTYPSYNATETRSDLANQYLHPQPLTTTYDGRRSIGPEQSLSWPLPAGTNEYVTSDTPPLSSNYPMPQVDSLNPASFAQSLPRVQYTNSNPGAPGASPSDRNPWLLPSQQTSDLSSSNPQRGPLLGEPNPRRAPQSTTKRKSNSRKKQSNFTEEDWDRCTARDTFPATGFEWTLLPPNSSEPVYIEPSPNEPLSTERAWGTRQELSLKTGKAFINTVTPTVSSHNDRESNSSTSARGSSRDSQRRRDLACKHCRLIRRKCGKKGREGCENCKDLGIPCQVSEPSRSLNKLKWM